MGNRPSGTGTDLREQEMALVQNAGVCEQKEKGLNSLIINYLRVKALFVRAKGLEPLHRKAPDPKSGLSTNFNTPAFICYLPPLLATCRGWTAKVRILSNLSKIIFF